MKSGSAVIASDIPVHREIYAEAAEFFNPYSVDALSHAIQSVIDPLQSERRAELLKKGAIVAERYSHASILPKWQSFLQSEALALAPHALVPL
jgi:glycosyltransferase involved in cell wall biosynthesis